MRWPLIEKKFFEENENRLSLDRFYYTKTITMIKKHLYFGAILFVVASMLHSCAKENASDVNQAKIYTDYEVFYDKNSDVTTVVARFRFGGATGTILELDDQSYVRFNTDTLAYNGVYGGHVKQYAGRITSGSFTYKNNDGSVFVNSIPVCDTAVFSPSFTQLQKSQAQTITWMGSALAPNQSVGIFIGTPAWGQDALAYQDLDGATNIVLGINQMSSLAVGSATAYMDRQTEVAVAQGTSEGGRIRTKYRALNHGIQIIN
jgi:hypothetical protein